MEFKLFCNQNATEHVVRTISEENWIDIEDRRYKRYTS